MKKYGGILRHSNTLAKIAESGILKFGGLGVSMAIYANKINNGEDKASDAASLVIATGLTFIAVTNPVALTALALYAVGEVTGVNDNFKSAFDRRFDNGYQELKASFK